MAPQSDNPHWARVLGYCLFSLWANHKDGLCPRSGDINRLMMMMTCTYLQQNVCLCFMDSFYHCIVRIKFALFNILCGDFYEHRLKM
jgi:hypothetical protein